MIWKMTFADSTAALNLKLILNWFWSNLTKFLRCSVSLTKPRFSEDIFVSGSFAMGLVYLCYVSICETGSPDTIDSWMIRNKEWSEYWIEFSAQTSRGSFSAVSTPIFASKYALESSRRDLQIALLCTVLVSSRSSIFCLRIAKTFANF